MAAAETPNSSSRALTRSFSSRTVRFLTSGQGGGRGAEEEARGGRRQGGAEVRDGADCFRYSDFGYGFALITTKKDSKAFLQTQAIRYAVSCRAGAVPGIPLTANVPYGCKKDPADENNPPHTMRIRAPHSNSGTLRVSSVTAKLAAWLNRIPPGGGRGALPVHWACPGDHVQLFGDRRGAHQSGGRQTGP